MSGTNTICVRRCCSRPACCRCASRSPSSSLEAPAGLIRVRADCANGKVTSVTFRNVPAFAAHLDTPIEVPHLGTVRVDVAYGGMFYVIADAAALGLRLTPDEGRDIARIGEMIKAAAREQLPVVHPRAAGVRRRDDRAALRSAARRRGNSRRTRSSSPPATLDWDRPSTWTGAHRPLAVRHRHVREDGVAARQGPAGPRRGLPPRGHARAPCSPAGWSRRRRSVGEHAAAVVPTLTGSGLDHRASRSTSSTRRIRSRRASRSATSGSQKGPLARGHEPVRGP